MSGVWVFRNGVVRLEEKPKQAAPCKGKKALVHTPSGQPVSSHDALQRCLLELGRERYYEDPALVQFHRRSSVDLISLPADFASVGATHMNDIVVKNRNCFRVVNFAA
ncbi:unnamed protein product [Urochloa decumbens]|uniref:Uncharacterized protein n=1 Tax=Urochloa decumbens TaxID=240449 RepID=A0ABC9ASS7_9POAL